MAAPPATVPPLWTAPQLRLRQKVLSLGRTYYLETPQGALLGFAQAKAFKLREELRVYADEAKGRELLMIKQAQILDTVGRFDVTDSATGQRVGSIVRKFWRSWVRDEWTLLDAQGQPVASLKEESLAMAILTRLPVLGLFVPKRMFLFANDGRVTADFQRQLWSLGTWTVDITDPQAAPDRRLVVAALVLMEAVEQGQE